MKITLQEPELTLEVNKVDTPTGAGWCIMMPDDRNVLIKFHQGEWETADNISNLFLQAVGAAINHRVKNDLPGTLDNSYRASNPRPKRAGILK